MSRRATGVTCLFLVTGILARSTPAQAGSCANIAPGTCISNAFFSNGEYGDSNTVFGYGAFLSNVSGGASTAFGNSALWKNTTGNENVAVGVEAMSLNTTGSQNVAVGSGALLSSTADGSTAIGHRALFNNTTGPYNTATGFLAMYANTTGEFNTANGHQALFSNTTGIFNVAVGTYGLNANTTGFENTAVGPGALMNEVSGYYNVAVGLLAGSSYTGGESYNIALATPGTAGDFGVTRIGKPGNQFQAYIAGIYGATVSSGVAVYVNSSGQLGTTTSSLRFKEDVADMGAASDELMSLRPVTFHYKPHYDDGQRILQYGLIAEEVAAVDPGLVQYGEDGRPLTVRYHLVNAMLLGEVQKQHATIAQQAAEIGSLKTTVATQDSAIAALAERLAKLESAAASVPQR